MMDDSSLLQIASIGINNIILTKLTAEGWGQGGITKKKNTATVAWSDSFQTRLQCYNQITVLS